MEKTIQGNKQEISNRIKIINKLQEDAQKYKMYYENCHVELAETKRTLRNLNALVERKLSITDEQDVNPKALLNSKQAAIDKKTTAANDKKPAAPVPAAKSMREVTTTASSSKNPNPPTESQPASGSDSEKKESEKDVEKEKMAATAPKTKPTWGDRMDEQDKKEQSDDDEENEGSHSCQKCLIYMGNIPPNTREEDVKSFFGEYVLDIKDITVTRKIIRNKERSMYATVKISESDKDEVLQLNGVLLSGKQVVIEESQRPKKQGNQHQDDGDDDDGEEEKSETVCRFYLQGRCNKPQGKCRFKHPKPCSFHANNKHCKFGDQCKFAHITKKNSRGQGQEEGSVALLTTFLQALGLPKFSLNKNSRNG